MSVPATHTFIWIELNRYVLLDSDLHKLPREGWFSFSQGRQMGNDTYILDLANPQPDNPYITNYGNLRKLDD